MLGCVCNRRIPWLISVGKDFPTEIVLISANFSRKKAFPRNVPDVQQGLWRRRWLPVERSATLPCISASAVSVLGSFAVPSLATLLRSFAVIAVSEHEADYELEEVAILRGKHRLQPTPGPTTSSFDRFY